MVKDRPSTHFRQQGLTLVELLVGLLLQSLVLLILAQLYLSGESSLRMQQEIGKVQARGHYAASLLANDLRTAGYVGCRNLEEPSFEVRMEASGVDKLTSVADTIAVMKNGSGWSEPEGFTRQPDTDVLRAVYAIGGAFLAEDIDHDTGQLEVQGTVALFSDNDLLLLSDCKTTHLFRAGEVALSDATLSINYAADLSGGEYIQGSQLLKFMDVTWFVAIADDHDEPGLYRQVNVLAPVLVASSVDTFAVEKVESALASGIHYELVLATQRQLADAAELAEDRKARRTFSGYFNLRNFGA